MHIVMLQTEHGLRVNVVALKPQSAEIFSPEAESSGPVNLHSCTELQSSMLLQAGMLYAKPGDLL